MRCAPRLTLGLVLVAAEPTRATSYYCDDLPARVAEADAVVIGRTIIYEPALRGAVFEIEAVLLGEDVHVGQRLDRRAAAGTLDGPHLPPPAWGRRVLFLRAAFDGALCPTPCGTSPDEDDLRAIRTAAAALRDPLAHLSSDDPSAVAALLHAVLLEHGGRVSGARRGRLASSAAVQLAMRAAGHAEPQLSALGVRALAAMRDPRAFDVLVNGLWCDDDHAAREAARALGRMGQVRAVGPLVQRLDELRALHGQPRTPAPHHPTRETTDSRYRHVGAPLLDALAQIGGASAVTALHAELAGPNRDTAIRALGRCADPAAIDLLLALDPIPFNRIELSDHRVRQAAVERMLDDPAATYWLAVYGGPVAGELMPRLAHGGHPAGLVWSAVSCQPEAARLLDESLPDYARGYLAAGFGRQRRLDVAASFAGPPDGSEIVPLEQFVRGLCEGDDADRLPPADQTDFVAAAWGRLWAVACTEGWTADEYELACELAQTAADLQWVVTRDRARAVWPPPGFADAPSDVRDADAVAAYFSRSARRQRLIAEIASGPPQVAHGLLDVTTRAGVRLPRDLLVRLATRDASLLAQTAARKLAEQQPLPVDVLRMMLQRAGSGPSAWPLHYIHTQPKPGYAEIAFEALTAGRFVYADDLYKAIITTDARRCIPWLRNLLSRREHIDARRRAAVTLAFLGDDSGREIMLAEHERLAPLGHTPDLIHVRAGLRELGVRQPPGSDADRGR